jgi:hypothetical protein
VYGAETNGGVVISSGVMPERIYLDWLHIEDLKELVRKSYPSSS